MLRRMAFLLIGVALVTPAIAADPVARVLSDLLNDCPQVPDATAVLIALQREHRIGRPAGTPTDDEGCWRVRPAITISLMKFQYICAQNAALADLLPDLFFSSPGMHDGVNVRILTTTPIEEVLRWAEQNLSPNSDVYKRIARDPGYYPLPERDKLTQIRCDEVWDHSPD